MAAIQSSQDAPVLVDTTAAVARLIDSIVGLPINPPAIYIDLEGVKLSRFGTSSILQILVYPTNITHLIDAHTLEVTSFSTAGSTGETLESILEAATIPKVIFDIRRDSDALYAHFGIKLGGVQDLQLMELSGRPAYRKRRVNGLAKCVNLDLELNEADKKIWKEIKEKGLELVAPERSRSYEVFNARPLPEIVKLYCIQGVQYMPTLWDRELSLDFEYLLFFGSKMH